jgi:hypothetical protein
VWTSCVAQNEATLARAARWDGVFLAALEADGRIDPVPVERVRDAHREIAGRRPTMDGFDLAVTVPEAPDAASSAAYRDAGATWIVLTGWVEALHDLVHQLPQVGPSV